MKKIISLLLSALLVTTLFTALPVSVSAAQPDRNGFDFKDRDAAVYDIYVEYGTAYNVMTGKEVTSARAGEKLRVEPNKMPRFKIFLSYYSDNVVLDETDWSFTMPDKNVGIYMNYDVAYPLNIDLSSSFAVIGSDTYNYLVDLIQSGELSATSIENPPSAHPEYYINFSDGADVRLTYNQIYTYDYDYAPIYSIIVNSNRKYNPINFIFSQNRIYNMDVDLTIPAVGSAWDFATMRAEIVPTVEGANAGNFTVSDAYWYDHWGLSVFETFEGNGEYFVEFTVTPEDGYYLTYTSEIVLHAEGYRDITLEPLSIESDGSVIYGNGDYQYRLVGGEPHSITVNEGYAMVDGKVVTEAVPGQYVVVHISKDAVGDNMYVVMGSDAAYSSDVEVNASEEIGRFYFYMPDHDVTVGFTYESEEQLDLVWDLYNGAVTVSDDHTQKSIALGVYNVLHKAAAKTEYVSGGTYYDIDGNGSYDIKQQGRNVFSLTETNSLTNNIKLQPEPDQTLYYAVRSVTIQVKEPVKHRITVSGGVASSKEGDFANNYVITEAYEGETVYVMPNVIDIDDDSYVAQFSMRATSNDVDIDDEAGISFTMPDKDVNVRLDYDCYTQDDSIMDFRYDDTVTLTDDGTGPRSEVYGVSMLIRLLAAGSEEVSEGVCRYDLNADGIMDIEQNSNDNSYTLLSTNSLPEDGMTLTLSREQSWTLPIRALYLVLNVPTPPLRGDVDFDGKVTIEDATLIQRHFAEFLNPNNGPLIDETVPEWFYRADANNDGKFNIRDVTAIQRCVAGFEELMP